MFMKWVKLSRKYLKKKGARLVTQAAVQLHGGIGTTDEPKVGHYLRHIEVLIHQFGATQSHIGHYQALR